MADITRQQRRAAAIAWGYEIEGGPASAPAEDSPERLRERREALVLSVEQAAGLVARATHYAWHAETVRRCEDPIGKRDPWDFYRGQYAAALSAEEARRAARFLDDEEARAEAFHAEPERPAPRLKVGDLDPVLRETARRTIALLPDLSARPLSGFGFNQLPGVDEWRSGKLTSAEWADQLDALLGAPASPPAPEVAPAPLPERPAPRFKVGDWVRVALTGTVYQVREVADAFGDGRLCYRGQVGCSWNGWLAASLEPASPPAPGCRTCGKTGHDDCLGAGVRVEVSPPAPEVVDVPQPETWHARLVRLSRAVVLATKAHDDAQSARHLAETRADEAWKALRAADHALKDATECAAILTAAQQGGAS